MKYTREEIELFKLRARLKKLERMLETEMTQGTLFKSMQEETKQKLRYEICRLRNRLNSAMENLG